MLEISRQKNCWQESDLLDAADGTLKEMDPRPHPRWLERVEKYLKNGFCTKYLGTRILLNETKVGTKFDKIFELY